jgi:hypothetical protein
MMKPPSEKAQSKSLKPISPNTSINQTRRRTIGLLRHHFRAHKKKSWRFLLHLFFVLVLLLFVVLRMAASELRGWTLCPRDQFHAIAAAASRRYRSRQVDC